MKNKIVRMEEVDERVQSLRGGRKLVFTNGCFDLLHVGHVRYLEAARALGDLLIIGVNGDKSVHGLKGPGRPLNNEADRAEVLAALESVDMVTIFPDLRATRLLEMIRPAVYVKGGDYTPETLNQEERQTLEKIGAEIRIIPFEPGYSTTALIQQLRPPSTAP